MKPENANLKDMQHSKWATSNKLFDYNSFINDFYALLEEYKTYKESIENAEHQPVSVSVL